MGRQVPNEKKILKEMTDIAFDSEQKTADRLRALDMLSALLEKQSKNDEAYEKLDAVLLAVLGDDER